MLNIQSSYGTKLTLGGIDWWRSLLITGVFHKLGTMDLVMPEVGDFGHR